MKVVVEGFERTILVREVFVAVVVVALEEQADSVDVMVQQVMLLPYAPRPPIDLTTDRSFCSANPVWNLAKSMDREILFCTPKKHHNQLTMEKLSIICEYSDAISRV
jgi:hypothetical protein